MYVAGNSKLLGDIRLFDPLESCISYVPDTSKGEGSKRFTGELRAVHG